MMRGDLKRVISRPPAAIRRGEIPTPLRRSLRRRLTISEGSLGGRPCLTLTPRDWAADGASLLYLHGGGYCVCSPQTHRALVAQIAVESGRRCLLLDYRLAPEHPYPAAIEDAVVALEELIDEVGEPRRVAIAGDSAGGGLSLAAVLSCRDAGRPLPQSMVLLSPWVDLTLSGESIDHRASTDYLSRGILSSFAAHYLAQTDPGDPLASPLWGELHGLPRTLVQLGGGETLLHEGQGLIERLAASGVAVEPQVFPGACHVFQAFAPLHPDAGPAIRDIGAFLRTEAGPT